MKVLIAEDDAVTRTALVDNLKTWGYQPVAAQNGAEAWALLQRADAPRLVLLDWVMPDLSGVQICRRLRQALPDRACYIILLTGKVSMEDLVAGFEAGADDYLVKPFSAAELRARIDVGMRLTAFQARICDRASRLESNYRAIFDHATEGIYQATPEGRYLTANRALARICGYPSAADLMAAVTDIGSQLYVDPGRYEEFKRRIESAGRVTDFESQIRRRDGTLTWISESARAVRRPDAGILHYEGFVQDIIRRKATEETLRRKSEELTAINSLSHAVAESLDLNTVAAVALESLLSIVAADIAILFRRQGEELHLLGFQATDERYRHDPNHVHRVGQCLCGLAARDGKPLYSKNIHQDPRCTWNECKRAGLQSFAALPLVVEKKVIGVLGLGSKIPRDFSIRGSFLETMASSVALHLQNAILFEKAQQLARTTKNEVAERTRELEDSQKALINVLEDVNEAKDQLENANRRLQELDRLKSMFIASMSHELRTPLNSIIGFTGILLQGMAGELNEEQRDQLQRVSRAGNHLLALITDVIDVSKIEAGKVDRYTQTVDLEELIGEAAAAVKAHAESKGLTLETRVVDTVSMETDRRRLLQCVINLLSNAVKYTEQGTVAVTARKAGDRVEIRVADTGIGIAEKDLARLFKAFARLESPLKIKTPGTGLGLYLTRKIAAELLDGEVSVESRKGEGSVFTLRVPITCS